MRKPFTDEDAAKLVDCAVELVALLSVLLLLAVVSILVNQYILKRELMMWLVPIPILIISMIGFANYFSKKDGMKLVVLKSLISSIFTALISLYLFLVLSSIAHGHEDALKVNLEGTILQRVRLTHGVTQLLLVCNVAVCVGVNAVFRVIKINPIEIRVARI